MDANVPGIPAAKSTEWNAESDWNEKFTNAGKIRVIATYGGSPPVSMAQEIVRGNSGNHDAGMKQVPMTFWEYASDPLPHYSWVDNSSYFN